MAELPNTGSTYQHVTKPGTIPSSNNNTFGSSETQQAGSATLGGGIDITQQRHTSTIPTGLINHSDEANPLQAHHRPSLSAEGAQGVQTLEGSESIGHHSKAQNAPGKLGERGENVLGAIGFGGSAVERPKEDQGIGEKIAEFLGA